MSFSPAGTLERQAEPPRFGSFRFTLTADRVSNRCARPRSESNFFRVRWITLNKLSGRSLLTRKLVKYSGSGVNLSSY